MNWTVQTQKHYALCSGGLLNNRHRASESGATTPLLPCELYWQRETVSTCSAAIYLLRIPLVAKCPREFATLETTVKEPAKKERAKSEPVEQKSTMLTAQVSWCAHAWNATPEEAAQQVVADLFDQLARGGTVSVHVEEMDGSEHTLQVRARG